MDTSPMRNILVNSPEEKLSKSLFMLAYKYAERGHKVLYIARKRLNKIPTVLPDTTTSLHKDILQNIIFRYYHKTHSALLKTLLELRTWKFTPKLIIIESLQLFFDADSGLMTYKDFIKNHSVVIASLQNAIHALSKQLNQDCFSIVSFDSGEDKFVEYYEEFLQTLVDLYYMKDGSFLDDVGEDFVDVVCAIIEGRQ